MIPRRPKNYDGSGVTSRHLRDLMPEVLVKITENFSDRPDLILAAWPDLIGSHLAPMTKAVSFSDGFLVVKVKNSSLYSLLCTSQKAQLVSALKAKFPKTLIKTILFKNG
jgi:Dna[CI] antecedent, DciA